MSQSRNKSLNQIQTRPAALQDNFKAGQHWSISFRFMELNKPFSFPKDETERLKIFNWLVNLNNLFDLNSLMNHQLPHFNAPTNHNVPADSFSEIGKLLLASKLENPVFSEFLDDRVLSLRFCYQPNSSQRLICLILDAVVYPIWWDQNHEIYGQVWEKKTSGLCKTFDCLHD